MLVVFCGNQLFEFYRNSTQWFPHDARFACGESWNKLLTDLYQFFCLLALYFYIAALQVFFECVSWQCFRLYPLNLIGPLTCIYGIC